MITRSRSTALLTVGLLGLGGFVASNAIAPGDPAVPAPVEQVHRYYGQGPTAIYEGDSGGIGSIVPLTLQVPSDGDRSAVVEVTFEYRTKGRGPFVADVSVRDPDVDPGDDGQGGRVAVRPEERALAPAPRRTTATVRFVVPSVAAGGVYATGFGVNSVFPGLRGRNEIRTRKVLVTVELTPR